MCEVSDAVLYEKWLLWIGCDWRVTVGSRTMVLNRVRVDLEESREVF